MNFKGGKRTRLGLGAAVLLTALVILTPGPRSAALAGDSGATAIAIAAPILGVVGVAAIGRYYSPRLQAWWDLREVAATSVAWWNVNIARPVPVLGNPMPIG